MAIHTTVYKADPGKKPFGSGDATFQNNVATINDPTEGVCKVGEDAKSTQKTGYCWRANMMRPFSGPPIFGQIDMDLITGIDNNGDNAKAEILKAKIEFECVIVAQLSVSPGEFRVGVYGAIFGAFYFLDDFSFGPGPPYTNRAQLPWVTNDADQEIFIGNLQGREFVQAIGGGEAVIEYTTADFTAGRIVSIGNGYDDLFAEIDLTGKLNESLGQRHMRLSDRNTIGMICMCLEAYNVPSNTQNFSMYTSAEEPAHSGMILTIEWDDHRTINTT